MIRSDGCFRSPNVALFCREKLCLVSQKCAITVFGTEMFCLAKVEVEFVLELACAERSTGAEPCNAEVEFVVGLARPERRPGTEGVPNQQQTQPEHCAAEWRCWA